MMRSKEDAHDYRYFPCPDLLPIRTEPLLEVVKSRVPELPHEKSDRFINDYKLTPYDASVLTAERSLSDYFEAVATNTKAPAKKAANWVINNLLAILKENNTEITSSPVTPQACLLYTSPSPRDGLLSRMPSSA